MSTKLLFISLRREFTISEMEKLPYSATANASGLRKTADKEQADAIAAYDQAQADGYEIDTAHTFTDAQGTKLALLMHKADQFSAESAQPYSFLDFDRAVNIYLNDLSHKIERGDRAGALANANAITSILEFVSVVTHGDYAIKRHEHWRHLRELEDKAIALPETTTPEMKPDKSLDDIWKAIQNHLNAANEQIGTGDLGLAKHTLDYVAGMWILITDLYPDEPVLDTLSQQIGAANARYSRRLPRN